MSRLRSFRLVWAAPLLFWAAHAWAAPAQPTALAVDGPQTTANSVRLTWTHANPPGTSYQVFAMNGTGNQILSITAAFNLNVVVPNLFPGTTYGFKVRAIDGTGTSTFNTDPPASEGLLLETTLTPASVAQSSAPASAYTAEPPGLNLRGLWHFDSVISTTVAIDSSSFANAGRLTCLDTGCASTPTYVSTGLPYLGQVIQFPGLPNSLVAIPDNAAYNFNNALTVGAWVNPTTTNQTSGAGIVARGDGVNPSFFLDVDAGTYRFGFFDSANAVMRQVVAVSTSIRAGQWDHVMGVFDFADPGRRLKIYVNGTLINSQATAATAVRQAYTPLVPPPPIPPPPLAAPNTYLAVGSRQSGTGAYNLGFKGFIDEVKIFSAALTDDQVFSQYLQASPTTIGTTIPGSSIQVTVPPTAFNTDATIYFSNDPANNAVRPAFSFLSQGLLNLPTGQTLVPNSLIEIVPTVGGIPFTGNLGSSATISIAYPDVAGVGLIDGTVPPISARTLSFYTLDTTNFTWKRLPTTIDIAARRASATTPHFSIFGLFGTSTVGTQLSQVRIYPRPWKKGSGGRLDAQNLTFDRLPIAGTLKIFTLGGQLVAAIPFSAADGGTVLWNGANRYGQPVASGVYFLYVQTESNKSERVYKFAIEK